MWVFIGYAILLVCVFGGFALSGGHLTALWEPVELLIIGGAAAGSFVVANGLDATKVALREVVALFKPSPITHDFQMQALSLLYELMVKSRREGLLALEADIENPKDSRLFQKYPAVAAIPIYQDFITDYMRQMISGNMDPIELESQMDAEIEVYQIESEHPIHAVTKMSDALPGFGIVAAVMGVVKTMGYLDQPPEVLGHKIAAALVGTFLGILLAYGFVGPLAGQMEHRLAERIRVLYALKAGLLACATGASPLNAAEAGRKAFFPEHRPTFAEFEQHMKALQAT